MSRDKNNMVSLTGVLQDPEEQVLSIDGQPAYAVLATLSTDLAVYGGSHRVLFSGQWALRAMAHWNACREAQAELEIVVHGWLRSGPNEMVVVCERASFFVSKQIHAAAMRLLNQVTGSTVTSGNSDSDSRRGAGRRDRA
jgi:hypothetical protein